MGLCSFEALLSPLPQSLILDTSQEPNISPYGPNSDGSKYVCVVKTRSDVLRYLFHALAPIALDVAARIISLVKSFSSINGKIPSDIASKAFVLFSLWLPHAPQLSSLVTELFDDDRFGSPFEYIFLYLRCRTLSEEILVDSSGQRPRYSMRTFCRALVAAHNLTVHQHLPLNRAILEGFELTFEGSLDASSRILLKNALHEGLGKGIDGKALDIPGRRPGGRNGMEDFILVKPFWLKAGPLKRQDWSTETGSTGKCRFVLTPTTKYNLRRLSRAIGAGPWPILLEGPTSTGKTTMVEYIAALCGHRCIRINNHEHTDVQEYTGTYAANIDGQLSFQEGLLVQALRRGYWVILYELNLAPSQVLEALNRLLDDNRELLHSRD